VQAPLIDMPGVYCMRPAEPSWFDDEPAEPAAEPAAAAAEPSSSYGDAVVVEPLPSAAAA